MSCFAKRSWYSYPVRCHFRASGCKYLETYKVTLSNLIFITRIFLNIWLQQLRRLCGPVLPSPDPHFRATGEAMPGSFWVTGCHRLPADRDVQQPGPVAGAHRQCLVGYRCAVKTPSRPDSESRRDRERLR